MKNNVEINDLSVVRYFIFNEAFRMKTSNHMDPHLFEDEHCKDIMELVYQYHSQFQKWPSDNIHVLITDNPWSQPPEIISEKLNIVQASNRDDYQNSSVDVTLKQTERWIRRAKKRLFLEDAIMSYQQNNVEDWSAYRNRLDEISNFTFEARPYLDVNDVDRMLEIHLKDVPKLPTAWHEMNQFLKGGWKKKSINVFQGGTHSGKSRFLLSLSTAIRRADPNNNVLYVTLEIQDEDFGIYSDMHLLEMTSEEIRESIRGDQGKWYREQKQKTKDMYGQLFVQEFAATSCSPSVVKYALDRILSQKINIVAVMVDYVGIMKSDEKTNNMYEKGVSNIIGLRSISQEFGIPFFTATQPDREGNRKNQKSGMGADMMNTAESKGIPDNSDFFGNIFADYETLKNGHQFMSVLKNRHSGRVAERLLMEVTYDLYKVDIVGKRDFMTGEEIDSENDIVEAPSLIGV